MNEHERTETLGDVHSLLTDSPPQMVAFTGLLLSGSWGIADVEHVGMFNVWLFLSSLAKCCCRFPAHLAGAGRHKAILQAWRVPGCSQYAL